MIIIITKIIFYKISQNNPHLTLGIPFSKVKNKKIQILQDQDDILSLLLRFFLFQRPFQSLVSLDGLRS